MGFGGEVAMFPGFRVGDEASDEATCARLADASNIDFSLVTEFTDDSTQMTDYYGDCLSEETHM